MRFARHLPRQPQLAWPKTGGPFHVIGARPDALLTGFAGEFIAEGNNIFVELARYAG
jgi:hypothetical protein